MTAEALSSNSQSFPMVEIQELETQDQITTTLCYHYFASQKGHPMIVSDIIIAPVVPANNMSDLNEFIQSLPASNEYPSLSPSHPAVTYSEAWKGYNLPLFVYPDVSTRVESVIIPNSRIPGGVKLQSS